MSIIDDIVNFFSGGNNQDQGSSGQMPAKLQAANNARNRRSHQDRQERQASSEGVASGAQASVGAERTYQQPRQQMVQQQPRLVSNQANMQRNLGGVPQQISEYTEPTNNNNNNKAQKEKEATPSEINQEKLLAANEARNKRAKKDTEETFDFSESLSNFMNSSNPYAQAYLNAHGINPGSFDWDSDYSKLASEGGQDIWADMITSSPKMKQAYMNDYGSAIDFNGDNDISLQEAGQWYQDMKEANQVESFDFTDTDNEMMQRIFGGLGGRGMNNDLIDALNMGQTMAIVTALQQGATVDDIINSGNWLTPIASDTGDMFVSTIGLLNDMSKEDFDPNSQEFGDKVARLNNAMKLDRLITAADRNRESGEKRNVIDFGDNTAKYAQQLNSLLNNVSGGDSNFMFSDRGVGSPISPMGPDGKIYDVPTAGDPNADALALANSVINSGGKDISDDLAYLLMNNLGAGNGQSLGDQGYQSYRSSGKYDDPTARREAEAQARINRMTQGQVAEGSSNEAFDMAIFYNQLNRGR